MYNGRQIPDGRQFVVYITVIYIIFSDFVSNHGIMGIELKVLTSTV
jgi:hypothetical protein